MKKHAELPIVHSDLLTLVDLEDVKKLSKYRWYLNHSGYVVNSSCTNRQKSTVRIHRIIMNAPKGMQVDHINHNKLDNRKENLRLCSNQQNNQNRRAKSAAKFKGIFWSKIGHYWDVKIGYNYKLLSIGTFKNEVHAAMAYDIWAKDLFGEFAYTNFKTIKSLNKQE